MTIEEKMCQYSLVKEPENYNPTSWLFGLCYTYLLMLLGKAVDVGSSVWTLLLTWETEVKIVNLLLPPLSDVIVGECPPDGR